jgi:hypothetical protein
MIYLENDDLLSCKLFIFITLQQHLSLKLFQSRTFPIIIHLPTKNKQTMFFLKYYLDNNKTITIHYIFN